MSGQQTKGHSETASSCVPCGPSARSDPTRTAGGLDDILEVARWSGSATNKQPWEILG